MAQIIADTPAAARAAMVGAGLASSEVDRLLNLYNTGIGDNIITLTHPDIVLNFPRGQSSVGANVANVANVATVVYGQYGDGPAELRASSPADAIAKLTSLGVSSVDAARVVEQYNRGIGDNRVQYTTPDVVFDFARVLPSQIEVAASQPTATAAANTAAAAAGNAANAATDAAAAGAPAAANHAAAAAVAATQVASGAAASTSDAVAVKAATNANDQAQKAVNAVSESTLTVELSPIVLLGLGGLALALLMRRS